MKLDELKAKAKDGIKKAGEFVKEHPLEMVVSTMCGCMIASTCSSIIENKKRTKNMLALDILEAIAKGKGTE